MALVRHWLSGAGKQQWPDWAVLFRSSAAKVTSAGLWASPAAMLAMALVETSSSTEVLPQLAGKAGQLGFTRVTLRTRLAVQFALRRVVVPRELAWS
jgi:hypothetical protein